MGKRYDVLHGREYDAGGQTKTAWTKVGVAFEGKGDTISVSLESVPVPQKNDRTGRNEVRVVLMVPRERDDKGGGGQRGGGGGRSQGGFDGPPPDDDQYPF